MRIIATIIVALLATSCTVTIGRSIEAATVNLNEKDSHALNIASPNASTIAREATAGEGATAPVLVVTASGQSTISQTKPITADAALLKTVGGKGIAGSQKDSTSSAEGGSDAIDVSPDVKVSPTGL
jgi:hypothetical protein